ncbi:MAG: GTP-binding protein [bacterium]|nr:GTP-binding protein [bacterium]
MDSENKKLNVRPPIVAVMGHIDHGKTTLLDYIRQTNIAGKEAGGITQSIGAYEISHNGKKITFIDTPGHEAFSKMRERGAKAADLAILVVAADDGVKPQTKEALKAIRQAEIPFVVAINKIDKNNADIERVKSDLRNNEVLLEGEGGDVSWQAISAKKGEGINELLDLILLVAEVADLKYNPITPANGIILTAKLDSQRGLAVSAVLRDGILKKGEMIATPTANGRIKILENFLGESVAELAPSSPVLILGFEKLPQTGEEFFVGGSAAVGSEKKSNFDFATDIGGLKVILRAEEAGSLEALIDLMKKISISMPLSILDASIGRINEGDVKMAAMTDAIVIGFRVKTDKSAENVIKTQKVRIIFSDVIYDLEKSLKEMVGADTVSKENVFEILAVFGQRKGKEQVVGGRVAIGVVRNQSSFDIFSNNEKIGSGRILNLQSQKKDIAKVSVGEEAGVLVETDISVVVGQEFVF